LTRFQRASESPHHSTGGSCDYVVNRRSVRFPNAFWRDFVMRCDRAVNAENHRLCLAGKMRDAERTRFAFYLNV
jgi:hypothetical protein